MQVQIKTNPPTKLPCNPGLSPNDWYSGWGQVTSAVEDQGLAEPTLPPFQPRGA
jgi:hypothetical protein